MVVAVGVVGLVVVVVGSVVVRVVVVGKEVVVVGVVMPSVLVVTICMFLLPPLPNITTKVCPYNTAIVSHKCSDIPIIIPMFEPLSPTDF